MPDANERDLADFFETASIGLHWVDGRGVILRVNQAELDMLGYQREEYVGRHIADFHVDRTVCEQILAFLANGERLYAYPAQMRCKDGSVRDVLINSSTLFEDGRFIHTRCFTTDVTERKRVETALSDSEQRLSAEAAALARLNEASTRLWGMSNLRDGLEEMLNATIDLLGADMGNIQLLEDGVLRIAVQRGFQSEFLEFFGEVTTDDDSACGRTLRAGVRTVIEDVERDPPYAPLREIAKAAGYRAVQSTPLVGRDGQPLGMISTHFSSAHRPGEQEFRRLDLYVRQAADFIERCRAEEALRESEQRFRVMADTAPAMLWITERDGTCTFLSHGWNEFTGQSDSEGLGFGWFEAVHPDDRDESNDVFSEALEKHEPFSLYHRIRHFDGDYRWVIDAGRPRFDSDGTFLGFIGSVIDVHAQHEAKEALRQSRDRFDIVREAAQVGFWFCDLPFDKLNWDARVKDHFWLPPEAEVNIAIFYDMIHPDDRERTRQAIEESIARKTRYDIEYRTVSRDAKEKWIRAIGRTFYDEGGRPIRFDGVTLDVTDRKFAAQERELLLESERAARTEAEHASRMKDEFLATLSHELRTPLNAILGYAQVLRMGKLDRESLDESVITIERNARLQAQLIEDLLDMNGIISGKVRLDLQRIDLPEAINAAIETVLPSVQAKSIRLEKILDPLAGPVRGDPARIQQVVWNLLSNAVKFTPKDGKIQVALERVNSHVEITVSDSGEGIAPDFLPHVFDRFRQADASTTRRHGGLGLGLSIVRQLVELHGGTVRAKSAGSHQGATFIVALPLIPVEVAGPRAGRVHPRVSTAPWAEFEADLTDLHVLVVDDERDGCEVVKRLLEQFNAKVEIATSAEDGFEALQTRRFDVLISDIGMPDEDGYQFVRRVRATGGRNQQIPAIALTAFARSEDRR